MGKKDLPSAEFIALATSRKKERSSKLHKLKGKANLGDFTSTQRGVIFLKNMPEGFEEKQMKGYFSQFGDITRLKLLRSKNDAKSLGKAYIEFQHEEVAQIVADTMDNYLMFECCLKCEVVPPEKLSPTTFKPSKYIYKRTDRTDLWKSLNKPLTAEEVEARKEKHKIALEKLRDNMKELGIEYDWGDLQANPDFVPPAKQKFPKLEKRIAKLKPKGDSIREQLEKYIQEFDFCENERGEWALNKWTDPLKRKRRR